MRRMIRTASLALAAGAAIVGAAGAASADAGAQGLAAGSPGVLSGNLVQVPVHVPVNACGNTVNVIGLLNPAFGNTCVNADAPSHHGGWNHQGW
ncbi:MULTISPECIES: chaplin [unclassified Streptomyces]|uniref:chaplin n=1 Tax=unclassified Streptomyces TaxID=2593676 RepID=UPI00081EC457|nr:MULTISPECIES: chaplin [unclassified Streptomyces]SCF07076.1 Small secreted domain [Streptomyces sp. LcepLS]